MAQDARSATVREPTQADLAKAHSFLDKYQHRLMTIGKAHVRQMAICDKLRKSPWFASSAERTACRLAFLYDTALGLVERPTQHICLVAYCQMLERNLSIFEWAFLRATEEVGGLLFYPLRWEQDKLEEE